MLRRISGGSSSESCVHPIRETAPSKLILLAEQTMTLSHVAISTFGASMLRRLLDFSPKLPASKSPTSAVMI